MRQLSPVSADPEFADDGELLGAHAAGDPQAFARLYDRYDRPCFLFIRRMLGASHGEAAEDLHQETWIAISKSAAAFDPGKASFRAWLFTIARHKVWDHFRRQRVTVVASARVDAALTIADEAPTPHEQVESRELAQRLVSAVEALPLAQRDVFVLFAHAGLSLEEISKVTGAGMETTKSRLRYARATLRLTLAAERSAHV
ncbi:MAG TPA: sigma-70 family RNA polymerase sigma factor [Caulobacteraceae bacterium]